MAAPSRPNASRLLSEDPRSTAAVARGAHRLRVHAWISGTNFVVIVLIWAFAGAGDFWPVWVLLPSLLAISIHAWVHLLHRRPDLLARSRASFSLAVTAGVFAALTLFNIGIWAASGGGSFWPVWPALAFAIVLAAMVGKTALAAPDVSELSERIDVLTSSRAGAVDAQEDKLRRIERDLHDGAQARLVALGMSLGMAEQKLDAAEPGEARELLAEARAGAEHALQELRDLARGIHPPVLGDRGLEAAVRSLVDASGPIDVRIRVELPDRPAPAVESAAYFICAEALANAAKHARAERVEIGIVRREEVLALEIRDDGVGGADPSGSGLTGLRRRVDALDGSFRVLSPVGGPTVVSAELPCGS